MTLDFPTIAVLGVLLCIGIAFGFSLLLLVLRRQPVLRLWTASLWLLSLSLALLAARPVLPAVPTILAGNVVIAAAGVLLLRGVALHLGYRLAHWQPLALSAVFLLGIFVFLVPLPSLVVRMQVFSVYATVLNGWMVWLLLRHTPPGEATSCRLAAVVFAAEALLYAVRMFLPVSAGAGEDIMRTGTPMFVTYLAGLVLELARCFALVLLLVERMLGDLRRLARTDGLTGLLNRRALLTDGIDRLQACRRRQQPFALLLLDVDHFKQINDRWGHLAGDEVLRHFASVLSGCVRDRVHLLGRYGGEEFVLLLPGSDPAAAQQLAACIRDGLRQAPAALPGASVQVTTSIGLAQDNGTADLALLLAAADAALYRAKAEGRDRAVHAPLRSGAVHA